MAELDYYSVMQKRIEYWAKKYDPNDRLSVKEDLVPEEIPLQKPKRIRSRISAGYTYVISMLF